jgi:hypothetical protein
MIAILCIVSVGVAMTVVHAATIAVEGIANHHSSRV